MVELARSGPFLCSSRSLLPSKDLPDHTLLINVGMLFDVRVIGQLYKPPEKEQPSQRARKKGPTSSFSFLPPASFDAPPFHTILSIRLTSS